VRSINVSNIFFQITQPKNHKEKLRLNPKISDIKIVKRCRRILESYYENHKLLCTTKTLEIDSNTELKTMIQYDANQKQSKTKLRETKSLNSKNSSNQFEQRNH